MPSSPPLLGRLLASAGGGVLLALGFPPFDLGVPVLPLAVAVLTLAVRGARLRTAALCGLVGALAFLLILLRWLTVIGVDAWLLVSLVSALYLVAMTVGVALVTRLAYWPLWVACLWVAQEAVRGRWPLGGFTWGRLAFGDQEFVLTPYAAVGGAPLVTFATALCGALIAWAALNVRSRTLVSAGALAAALALPAAALAIPTPTDGRTVTVAMVQGNVPRSGLDFAGQRQAVLDNHVRATEQLAEQVARSEVEQPDVVIWPENASDIDPFRDPAARAQIERAVGAIGAPVLVGAVVETEDRKNVLNQGIVWDPEEGPGARYTKQQLVPFGEYIPFRSLLGDRINRLGRISRDFLPGSTPGVLDLGPTTAADVICFEVAYDDIVRDAVVGGGEVIVVQTNNATYGRTGQPPQQALMSRVRAVEHGRPVVVASTSGISEFVQADGTVTDLTPEFEQVTLVREVEVRTGRTVADRVGALPELALTIVGLAAVVYALARRRPQAGRPGSEDA